MSKVTRETPDQERQSSPTVLPDFDQQLGRIRDIAHYARTMWYGLLGVVFVGVTLMAHRDADFFLPAAETTLPLVAISVPTASFFIFAPILVASLYCYFHLYLINLWDALGAIEQAPDAPPIDALIHPTLVAGSALAYRARRRGDRSAPARVLSGTTGVVTVLLVWVIGWAVLAATWWRSMPAHKPGLTLIAGLSLVAALVIGGQGLAVARARLAGRSLDDVPGRRALLS